MSRHSVLAWALAVLGALATHALVPAGLAGPAALAVGAVALSLFERVPPPVPWLVVTAAAPWFTGRPSSEVLAWSADPVLASFAGGLVLGLALEHHGLDRRLARWTVGRARGDARRLVAWVVVVTAALAAVLTGAAAAAVMLSVVRPVNAHRPTPALPLAVAMGANLGGLATPVGAGPNALAVAALQGATPLSFLRWMSLTLPLLVVCLPAIAGWLVLVFGVRGPVAEAPPAPPLARARPRAVWAVVALTLVAWVSEPWHGVSAASVALLAVVVLVGSGLLPWRTLGRLDWGALSLVAFGLSLGRLLEHGGLFEAAVGALPSEALSQAHRGLWLTAAATLGSAVMSNTATAALLLPLSQAQGPHLTDAVCIAVACAFGVALPVSTPANALALAEPSVTRRALLLVGAPVMVVGWLVVATTGPHVLAWLSG